MLSGEAVSTLDAHHVIDSTSLKRNITTGDLRDAAGRIMPDCGFGI